MVGNVLLNDGGGSAMGVLIAVGPRMLLIILTRLVTAPLKPVFRLVKSDRRKNREHRKDDGSEAEGLERAP